MESESGLEQVRFDVMWTWNNFGHLNWAWMWILNSRFNFSPERFGIKFMQKILIVWICLDVLLKFQVQVMFR